METINTKAICITFVLEWHGEMFIVFHRGNAKRIFKYEHDIFALNVGGLTVECSLPIYSTRNTILKKFVNDCHNKYQVCEVHDMLKPQIQRQVDRVAIKVLSPVCHTWNSKGRPVP